MSTRFSGKICGTSLGFGMAAEHEVYLLHFGESKNMQYRLVIRTLIQRGHYLKIFFTAP